MAGNYLSGYDFSKFYIREEIFLGWFLVGLLIFFLAFTHGIFSWEPLCEREWEEVALAVFLVAASFVAQSAISIQMTPTWAFGQVKTVLPRSENSRSNYELIHVASVLKCFECWQAVGKNSCVDVVFAIEPRQNLRYGVKLGDGDWRRSVQFIFFGEDEPPRQHNCECRSRLSGVEPATIRLDAEGVRVDECDDCILIQSLIVCNRVPLYWMEQISNPDACLMLA